MTPKFVTDAAVAAVIEAGYNPATAPAIVAIVAQVLSAVRPEQTERDADGRALICTGCGTTNTIAWIKHTHPTAFSCCPERKMVRADKVQDERNALRFQVEQLKIARDDDRKIAQSAAEAHKRVRDDLTAEVDAYIDAARKTLGEAKQ